MSKRRALAAPLATRRSKRLRDHFSSSIDLLGLTDDCLEAVGRATTHSPLSVLALALSCKRINILMADKVLTVDWYTTRLAVKDGGILLGWTCSSDYDYYQLLQAARRD